MPAWPHWSCAWPSWGQNQQGKGQEPRAEAVPWCFRRHSTQAISQLQLEAIVTSPHLCHPCTALKQSGHCSGPASRLGCATQHEAIVCRRLPRAEPRAPRIALLGGAVPAPALGSSTPGCMECIFKRINLFFCICGHIFGWGSIVRRQIMQEIFS